MTLVIGCYTAGTSYEEEAALLAESLDAVGMDHALTAYESRGDWYDNTAFKAPFLRSERIERDGPLLYVDVDTFFHENCATYFDGLSGEGYDFGAHFYRGPAKGGNQTKVREKGWRLLSTVMFLGDTPGCQALLDNWCGLNDLWRERGIREGGGQKNLWFTWTCMDLKTKRMPGRYNYTFDRSWAYADGERAIIEHTVASREHRDRDEIEPSAPRRAKIEELRRAL